MEYRKFGRTDLTVSEIGFGGWGIGGDIWGRRDDDTAVTALKRAFDLGITFYDTAYVYGDGHSEELIGQVLTGHRDEIVIATKAPPRTFHWPPLPNETAAEAFPKDWVVSCTERSLRLLKTDHVDIQQLHCWSERWLQETEWLEALSTLRDQGKIRYFGVSVCDWEPYDSVSLVESDKIRSIQVIYNIFEQRPQEKLLPAAEKHGVGIIARVPFEEGLLTGAITAQTEFDENDWRARWLPVERRKEVDRRLETLRRLLDEDMPDLATLALKFCLHHSAVSSVIPGMRRVKHVEANVKASDGKPISAEVLAQLRKHAFIHGWRYPWATDKGE